MCENLLTAVILVKDFIDRYVFWSHVTMSQDNSEQPLIKFNYIVYLLHLTTSNYCRGHHLCMYV